MSIIEKHQGRMADDSVSRSSSREIAPHGFERVDSGLLLPVDHSTDARPVKSVERDALAAGMAEGRGSYRYSDKLTPEQEEERRQDYFSDLRKKPHGSLVSNEEAATMHVAGTRDELRREAEVLPAIIRDAKERHAASSEAELYYEDVQRRLSDTGGEADAVGSKPHYYPGDELSAKIRQAVESLEKPDGAGIPPADTATERPSGRTENPDVWRPTVRVTSNIDGFGSPVKDKPEQQPQPTARDQENPTIWRPTARPTLAIGFEFEDGTKEPDSSTAIENVAKSSKETAKNPTPGDNPRRLLDSDDWAAVVERGKKQARDLGLVRTEKVSEVTQLAEEASGSTREVDTGQRPGGAYHEPDIRTRPAFVYDSDPEVLSSSTITVSTIEERFLHDADGMRREFFSPAAWHGPDFSPIANHVERVREACRAFAEEIIHNPHQPDLTRELLRDRDYAPVSSIVVGDREFYLSKVFVAGSRSMALGYTLLNSGQVAPRVFYKSMSSGGWRAPEGIAPNGHLGKGGDPRVYTNGTQVRGELATMLDGLEDQGFVVASSKLDIDSRKWYTPRAPGPGSEYRGPVLGRELLTWAKEVQVLAPDQRFEEQTSVFLPGYGFRTEAGAKARDYFSALSTELDGAIESVFARPPRRIDYDGHTLLGPIFRETYQAPLPPAWAENLQATTGSGDLGSLDIEICFDNEGRTWIGNIRYSGAPVTSYGTDAYVIPGGMLLNKPLEYSQQVPGLEPGVDYEPFEGSRQYVDISPLIEKLKIIRLFKRLRVIPATRRDTREEETQYFPIEST